MDDRLGFDARIGELACRSEAVEAYREVLDPDEAAEVLVSHAVLPLTDERFLDRVLRNARALADRTRLVRLGVSTTRESRAASCPPLPLMDTLSPLRGMA